MHDASGFFAFARERYRIHRRRRASEHAAQAGEPPLAGPPWTEDPVLQRWRFCNVFREDDRTTRWIRKHVTPEEYAHATLGALVIARWFNRVETLRRLVEVREYPAPLLASWAIRPFEEWAEDMRTALAGRRPLVTGAYMIKTPPGLSKLEGILWALHRLLPDAVHLQARIDPGETPLQGVTEVLSEYPYLGRFMAYEVACDLRWSGVMGEPPDKDTWASMGPGGARGLEWVEDLPWGTYRYTSQAHQDRMLQRLRELLTLSRSPDYWPAEWPPWEAREVEHTLCEYDKYRRAQSGERLKRVYLGTA